MMSQAEHVRLMQHAEGVMIATVDRGLYRDEAAARAELMSRSRNPRPDPLQTGRSKR
jgi:hypothetical protein